MLFVLTIVENEEERIKLEELYEMYRQEMHRQALAILKNDDDAEDAVPQHEGHSREEREHERMEAG